jgi:hypothetical protein
MRYGIFLRLVAALVACSTGSSAAGAAEPSDQVIVSLHAALAKGASHARDSLDQKDFKSLAQSAGSLHLLAELMQSRSDDATWQAAAGNIVSAAGDVQAAARGEDAAKCSAALNALDKAIAIASTSTPVGSPRALPKAPAIRSLMGTIDGVQADAKIALIVGNVEAAKKQAFVLAELSRLVSNSRSGDKWSSLAGDFTAATNAAATTTETDPKTVRQLFRGISQQCEICHESSRAR